MTKPLQNNEFDALLREKLSNVEIAPSEKVWDKIAPVIPKYNPWGQILTPFSKIFIGSLVFVGAVVISTLTLTKPSEISVNTALLLADPVENISNTELVLSESNNGTNIQPDYIQPIQSSSITIKTNVHSVSPITQTQTETESEPEEVIADLNVSVFANEPIVYQEEYPLALMDNISADLSTNLQNVELPQLIKTFPITPNYLNDNELSLNLSLHPEVSYFDKNLFANSTTNDFSINASIRYSTGDFFFETGISGTRVQQKNTYNNTTTTREVVDEYEVVDSVHFETVWDPELNQYVTVPIFYTSVITIYEYNTVTETQTLDDTYLYLQIPILIGLQKNFKKFTIEAKSGLTFSSLLFTSAKNNTYSNEDINIVLAEETLISPSRNQQYWSFIVGFGGSYHITDHIDLFVVPTYRYLLTPIYTGNYPSRKTPYAFGLQSGLRYIF